MSPEGSPLFKLEQVNDDCDLVAHESLGDALFEQIEESKPKNSWVSQSTLEVVNEEPEMSKESPRPVACSKPPIHPSTLMRAPLTPSMIQSEGSDLHSLKTISSVNVSEIQKVERKKGKKKENTKASKSKIPRNST